MRHAWLVALITIVGAGLSVMLALRQKPTYSSEAVLLYQEKISQSVLQGRDVASGSRTQSARFKEMLLSRTTLSAVVEEFNLYPDVVESQGTVAAAEKLRLLVEFRDRGAGTFRIAFLGDTPEQAQRVTARLASLLQDKDEAVRKEQAEQTKTFLENEKVAAENTLFEAESAFAVFTSEHPEFVVESATGGASGAGASIRAAAEKSSKAQGSSKADTLRRAARRLRDRIANPDAPVVATSARTNRVESPALQQARGELDSAKRSFADKSARFTPKHPDVIAAKNNVAEVTRRLKRLEAAEKSSRPASTAPTITPTTSVADLKKELSRIESEISRLSESSESDKPDPNSMANELVGLETKYARLQRQVDVSSQRLSSLESRVFTAEITASSEFAEAAKLVVIDEAYLPARPAGKGRKMLAMAGTVVFICLGCGLALGLALLDDRVYRRADIDDLGIAPVLVVIPKSKKSKKKKRLRRG
tara:strand:- start:43535 stop:44965 length:1431 start_codon:yes stop_codon:yes gene_type:complete